MDEFSLRLHWLGASPVAWPSWKADGRPLSSCFRHLERGRKEADERASREPQAIFPGDAVVLLSERVPKDLALRYNGGGDLAAMVGSLPSARILGRDMPSSFFWREEQQLPDASLSCHFR